MNSAGKVDISGWFPMPILAHTQTDGLVLRSRQKYIRLTEFAIPSIFATKQRRPGMWVASSHPFVGWLC